jgi:hypothetical protein
LEANEFNLVAKGRFRRDIVNSLQLTGFTDTYLTVNRQAVKSLKRGTLGAELSRARPASIRELDQAGLCFGRLLA